MAYDLHIHSNCSRHVRRVAPPPEKIIQLVKEARLEGFALTDHDSRAGVEKAQRAAEKAGIDFIPGIEMSFSYRQGEDFYVEGEILGYFIDPDNFLLKQIERRNEDTRKIRDSGLRKALDISKERMPEGYSRDDLADVLVEDGQTDSRERAYSDILKPAGKSIVQREKNSLKDAVSLIYVAGGIPIVAHVGMSIRDYWLWPEQAFESKDPKLKEKLPKAPDGELIPYNPERDFEKTLLPVFLESGIRGFEIYPYPLVGKGVSNAEHIFFNTYAKELNRSHGLINNVRGSDCHFQPQYLTNLGCWQTDKRVVEQLRAEHLKITKAL